MTASRAQETVRAVGRRRGVVLAGVLLAATLPVGLAHAEGATFTVTSTGDGPGCTASACTLRGAITAANRANGHARIEFDIPGTGPFTISPTSLLPMLNNPAGITLDGYTQPGAAPNTHPTASNAQLRINLKGQGPKGFEGLRIGSDNNTVRGLAVFNWPHSFVVDGRFSGTGKVGHNRIVGNFVCTDTTGTYRAPGVNASAAGLILTHGAHHNAIGAPTAADRNVISGCAHRGLTMSFTGTDFNTVQNNIVGLTPDGRAGLPNRAHGLDINYSANDNLFGGTGPFERNVISGNMNEGIEVSHGKGNRRNRVIGNFIGTDLTGGAAPAYAGNGQSTDNIAGYGLRLEGEHNCDPCDPNAGFIEVAHNVVANNSKGGILIDKGQQWNWVHDNLVGVLPNGTPAGNGAWGLRFEHGAINNTIGPGNTIAYNAAGVQMQSTGTQPPSRLQLETPWNRLTRNSIHSNGGSTLGIDLAPYGKPNINGVGDPKVNHGIQAPTVTSAKPGAVSGTACAGCVVEVFLADGPQSTSLAGFGEPRTYVGSTTANGSGAWTLTPSSPLSAGKVVTATATRLSGIKAPVGVPSGATASGDTSEAARNRAVS